MSESSSLSDPALRFEIRGHALRRLGLREHSRQELETWLLRKFGKDHRVLIDEVLAQIEAQGGLSDERYAQAMTRYQERRGKGAAYIQAKLREKGVKRSISQIREVVSEDTELEAVRRILERRYSGFREDARVRARALQALVRRGFSLEIARKALKEPESD